MDDRRIYEKIKEYEKLGKSISDLITDLCIKGDAEVERVLDKLFETNERIYYAQMIKVAIKNAEFVEDFNDIGISMIDTDEDW